jgi:hypothetical protein
MNKHKVLMRGGASLLVADATDYSAHYFDSSHKTTRAQRYPEAPVYVA